MHRTQCILKNEISLFAGILGTIYLVSLKKLDKADLEAQIFGTFKNNNNCKN